MDRKRLQEIANEAAGLAALKYPRVIVAAYVTPTTDDENLTAVSIIVSEKEGSSEKPYNIVILSRDDLRRLIDSEATRFLKSEIERNVRRFEMLEG